MWTSVILCDTVDSNNADDPVIEMPKDAGVRFEDSFGGLGNGKMRSRQVEERKS